MRNAAQAEPFVTGAGPYQHGELRVLSFSGREAVSRLFAFDVTLSVAGADEVALPDALLGQPAHFSMVLSECSRVISGIVSRVAFGAVTARGVHTFKIRISPSLFRLKKRVNTRIFQDESINDIISHVLDEHKIDHRFSLARTYPIRSYCVQYEESDYDFICRLLSEEGILYFFQEPETHPTDSYRPSPVVFCDHARLLPNIMGKPILRFRPEMPGMTPEEDHLFSFSNEQKAQSNTVRMRHYDFRRPRTEFKGRAQKAGIPSPIDLDVYNHHGEYDEPDAHDAFASLYLEQIRRKVMVAAGTSACRRLAPGYRFGVTEHDYSALNREYSLISVHHRGKASGVYGMADDGPSTYSAEFQCIPSDITLRPKRPKRRVYQAMETATVMGPAGKEVHTDEYGRIRVQFHWDPKANPEQSSCWVRVSQAWAGEGFGVQFIPRIGMEVLVSFIGGDLDRPVVTGCLHNAAMPPPFQLPDRDVMSGIKTRSSPGGAGAHLLSFDDKAGSEKVTLSSFRNLELASRQEMSVQTGNDRTTHIRGDDHETVEGDVHRKVKGMEAQEFEGARETTVRGQETLYVDEGKTEHISGLTSSVWEGGAVFKSERSYALSVRDHLSIAVGSGSSTAQINVAGNCFLGTTKAISLVSEEKIILRVGSSTLEIEPDSITLNAKTIQIKGENVVAEGDGPRLSLSDEAELVSKKIAFFAEKARIELDTDAIVKGSKVLLNCSSRDPKEPDKEEKKKETKPFGVELTDADFEPYANKHYVLAAGGERIEGETDGSGKIQHDIPKDTELVDITLWIDEYPTGKRKSYQIRVKALPPANTPEGAMERLSALGYYEGAPQPELTEEAKSALRWFQKDHELDESGELDDKTASELEKVAGG